jgi:hypothetical protein
MRFRLFFTIALMLGIFSTGTYAAVKHHGHANFRAKLQPKHHLLPNHKSRLHFKKSAFHSIGQQAGKKVVNQQPPKPIVVSTAPQLNINQPKNGVDNIINYDFDHSIKEQIEELEHKDNIHLPSGNNENDEQHEHEHHSGGDNEYYPGDQVNAVPVPAAIWLFGSALLGLFGLKRKEA